MKTNKKFLLSLLLSGFTATMLNAQVAINNTATSPDASAILDLSSGNAGVNKGFLPPQVALTDVSTAAPVTSPATGLMVYSTTAPTGGNGVGYYYWSGSTWTSFGGGGGIGGSGTANYVARFTPNGSTLGIGLIQDNNTNVGINGAPVAGTMLTVTGGASDNGINGVSTNTTSGSYGVHGSAYTGSDAYLSYVGAITAGGYTVTNTSGYFTSSSANGGAFVATSTGANTLPAVEGFSNVWHGGLFSTTMANANGVGGINYAASGTSTGNGVVGVTSQKSGFGLEGLNSYATSGIGIGVFGIGSGAAGNGFQTGEGVMGDGTLYGVEGYQESAAGSAGGYFQDEGGDFGAVADQADQAGGYFQDAAGDYSFIAYGGYGILSNVPKSTMVKYNNRYRVMFCDESPEVVFHDYGTATLSNGKVHVNLDPIYAKTVEIDAKHPLRVLITLNNQCNGVYVTHRTQTGFDVVELNNGHSNASFTYEVIANRANTTTYKGVARNYADMRYPVGPGPMVFKNNLIKMPNARLLLTPVKLNK